MSFQEEQEKLLEEASQVVKTQAFQMKRCLDQEKLMEALKYCSNMLSELRTGLLSPKYYYELYMTIFDQLRHLESFLVEEHRRGKSLSELYELVQYAGNILPRLYLLVTVGAVYIETKKAPTREILIDMVEMCRGVQHPTRGLFLRYYLSQMTKNKLPDVSTATESGNVRDSINFILVNFTEMNKLWVRMQHQGHSKDRERREKERRELKILVGTNLVRLSQLEGVDLEVYKTVVLPNILEQVINCKDVIAQEYLMECLIQVFHDELHLRTLEQFLGACAKFQKGVNVKNIIIALIDRLARFFGGDQSTGVPKDIPLFEIFSNQIKQIIDGRPDMPIQDALSLYVSLLNLTICCYPDELKNVDTILENTYTKLNATENSKNLDKQNTAAGKQLRRMLSIPVENYKNMLIVLKLEHFAPLMEFLSIAERKAVSLSFVESMLQHDTQMGEVDTVNKLLDLITSLIKDDESAPAHVSEELAEEQNTVARMIHLFTNENNDKQYLLLSTIRKHLGAGGARTKFTLPPLIFRSLQVALKFYQMKDQDENWDKKCQKVFQYSLQTTAALVKQEHYELCLRLFLQCALAADQCRFETIAYEFVTQAFVIYEENISDSKSQTAAISVIIGTLQNMRCFSAESYDTLAAKCASYSSRLLKKPDQCNAVQLCSHLFWQMQNNANDTELYREGKKVLECLQKSLKIADTCMEPTDNCHLFVEILNRYLYYYERQNEHINAKYINGLIDLINTNLGNLQSSDVTADINRHFQNTLKFVQWRAQNPNQGKAAYNAIEISNALKQ